MPMETIAKKLSEMRLMQDIDISIPQQGGLGMLKVKILGADGNSVSRDELATLYASDTLYNPFHRKNTVYPDGLIELNSPLWPIILHAKLHIPGYGHMWVVADNCGQGYKKDSEIDFIREAAESRVYETDKYINKGGFTPSAKCLSKLADAKAMLKISQSDGLKSAKSNMIALSAAMWAGELAAVERAREVIKNRAKREFLFGCGGFTYPYSEHPGMKEMFDSIFNYATLPFYLGRVEKEFNKPDYTVLDKLQDAYDATNITTKGHPLWWTHTAGMPPWTESLKWDDGSIAREIDRVVKRSVNRYKGRIRYYDAINEAHDWCNAYMLTQQQLAEMTKLCCDAIHDADPTVNAVINTCFMFGENVADERVQWGIINERNMTPYTYLERVESLGTQYETIGIQLYCPSRDMLELEKMYDRFSIFGKPLHLTELGVPSHYRDVGYNTTEGDLYCLRYMYSGLWHEPEWNEGLQADWMEWFYTISYAHPSVEALTWWSFNDPGYVPASGMHHRDGTPKEICFRLKALEQQWGFNFGKFR